MKANHALRLGSLPMKANRITRLRHPAAQLLFGIVGLALLTFVCFGLELNLATTAFAYLILIALLSRMGSFVALAALSIVAVGCLRYFFASPIFDFRVNSALDAAIVGAFLITSLVVTGLVRRARGLAQAALGSQKALAEQASLLDLTHDSVFVRDMNDVITYWNRGAEERYGWTREEALDKVTHQLLQTVFPASLAEINAELHRTGRWEGELIHTKRDGTKVVVASRWSLQRDEQGRPVTILETNNDITERKRWRSLTEALPQLVWAATPDGACDYFSTQWTEYTGLAETDLLGWRWMEVLHPDDRENTRQLWGDSVAGRRDYDVEYRVRRHDGAYGWFKTRGTPIRDSEGGIIKWFGTCTDITDQKRAEQALYRSEQELRRARDQLEMKVAERTAELQRSETRYRNIFQTVGVSIWEEDFSQLKAAIDALKDSGVEDFRRYLAANPQFVQQAISMVRVVDVNDVTLKLFAAESKGELLASLDQVFVPETREVFVEELVAIAEGRTSFEAETILQTLKGERLTVLFTMTFPPPPAGFERVLVSVTDITERKLAEVERARLGQRLRQAEKMEAVGRLAGGIAHDFNNILGGILGYGEMVDAEAAEGTPMKRYARNLLTGANRARDLVDQILTYSRSQHAKRVPVEMDRVVRETLELVRGSLAAGIALDLALPAAPLIVVADRTQLHQVVMNLCTNALHAMRGSGTLRVGLEAADMTAERVLAYGTLAPGRYVRLMVADTGSGMDAATLARIFEPFFTTKEVGRGTGLGLSLVYGIVTDSGGAIHLASEVGRGSAFEIYLPRVEVPALVVEAADGPVPRGNGERVLLVDDEEPLIVMTAEVLAQLGYEATPFTDGRAALEAFEKTPEAFQVVVTDEVMPALTGTDLARRVRRLRPDLPIVLVSGYSGPILTQQALSAGVSELLKKPVQSRELAAALARVLQRAA